MRFCTQFNSVHCTWRRFCSVSGKCVYGGILYGIPHIFSPSHSCGFSHLCCGPFCAFEPYTRFSMYPHNSIKYSLVHQSMSGGGVYTLYLLEWILVGGGWSERGRIVVFSDSLGVHSLSSCRGLTLHVPIKTSQWGSFLCAVCNMEKFFMLQYINSAVGLWKRNAKLHPSYFRSYNFSGEKPRNSVVGVDVKIVCVLCILDIVLHKAVCVFLDISPTDFTQWLAWYFFCPCDND